MSQVQRRPSQCVVNGLQAPERTLLSQSPDAVQGTMSCLG